MKISRKRLLAGLAVAAAALSALFIAAPRRHSATVEIDASKTTQLVRKAWDTPSETRSRMPFACAAYFEMILREVANGDEFRSLPLSRRFSDDDSKHTGLVSALGRMCVCFGRSDPAAIRVTVTASSAKEAETIAELIGKRTRRALVDGVINTLGERRAIERREVAALNAQIADLSSSLNALRETYTPAEDQHETSASLLAKASALTRRESITRQIALLNVKLNAQLDVARRFDDLAATVEDTATSWLVPATSLGDPGWTRLADIPRSDVAFGVLDPVQGKDWLSATLSPTGETLDFVLGIPEVRQTDWMRSFRPAGGAAGRVAVPDLSAAKRDLCERVRLTPIGDGSVIAVGLGGSLGSDDYRRIVDSLSRGILSASKHKLSAESVRKRELLDQQLDELGAKIAAREDELRLKVDAGSASSDSVHALFESTDPGREWQTMIELGINLEMKRRRLVAYTERDSVGISLVKSGN